MIPSMYPIFDLSTGKLHDGLLLSACGHCKKNIVKKTACSQHYRSLVSQQEGYYQCPLGFTTRSFFCNGQLWIITGVVAFPRFGSENERLMAKRYGTHKVTREAIESGISYLRKVELYKADAIQETGKFLPQAFHELRKLNGAIIQHAEREINERSETRNLLSIKSAAELMRNNFDILEALSNIESMRALPSDSTINLFDLVYKMKRILQEKAETKRIYVNVTGVRAIIEGSQKSFPIVPAVLLENSIKYGIAGGQIQVTVSTAGDKAVLTVENASKSPIDINRCFERGVRFSTEVEGGGYGLFLAREIVICHGGTIRCETSDESVRMTVELPLKTVITSL